MGEKEEYVRPPEIIGKRNTKRPGAGYNIKSSVGKTLTRLQCHKIITPNKTVRGAAQYDRVVEKLRPQLSRSVQCNMKGDWNVIKLLLQNDV